MPAWSPDGTRIVFSRSRIPGGDPADIWVMEATGASQTKIAGLGDSCDQDPDWQPLPVNAYPRPKGASPTYLSLVPAYSRCTVPNDDHGPPLSFGSCAPPAPSPSSATIGQRSIGFAIMSAKSGNPATVADEADVRLRVSVSDVRSTPASATTGPPWRPTPPSGSPTATTLRTPADRAGTVVDVGLRFSVPCTPTADATVGSNCGLTTTVETLVPNAVKEGRRSVWELSSFDVNDGDEGEFLRPGVFLP